MFFFKKKSIEDAISNSVKEQGDVHPDEGKKDESMNTGNAKLDIQLTKMQAQIDSFAEIRKANSETFSRFQEQIGEVRGMITDTSKQIGSLEAKSTKAADLVESVQPEKLMIEVRKMDGKVEALRANIESNESMMQDIMKSLKEMRTQMNFYKGVEQVSKMMEEVKKEMIEIKRVEANTKRNADRIDTMFLDFNKKYTDFAKFDEVVKALDKTTKEIQTDFDKSKVTMANKAEKKEFTNLLDKFNEFEKHTNNILRLLDERSKHTKEDMLESFENIKKAVAKKYQMDVKQIDKPVDEKKDETKKDDKKKTEDNKIIDKPLGEEEKTEDKKE